MIAFLGMGHLGANFVKAMLKKGKEVHVWNRTTSKAKALEAFGAKPFDHVADAVSGADTIHLTLKDDTTVNDVLEEAFRGLKAGATIIDHTTTTAQGAAERTGSWKKRGFTYLHAPVFMGPQNALDSTGTMLVSGDQEVIARVGPELSAMTGKVINFGPVTNKAAGIKLLGNLFLLSVTAGLADTLALAKALGIEGGDVAQLFEAWNPGMMIPSRLKKITSNTFNEPTWELNMARKDAGLMMAEAKNGNVTLALIPAIAEEMDHWIEQGHGKDDYTVIAKNSVG